MDKVPPVVEIKIKTGDAVQITKRSEKLPFTWSTSYADEVQGAGIPYPIETWKGYLGSIATVRVHILKFHLGDEVGFHYAVERWSQGLKENEGTWRAGEAKKTGHFVTAEDARHFGLKYATRAEIRDVIDWRRIDDPVE